MTSPPALPLSRRGRAFHDAVRDAFEDLAPEPLAPYEAEQALAAAAAEFPYEAESH